MTKSADSKPRKNAKESPHIRRTRKKLERRLSEIDSKITPQALREVAKNIHSWIKRHEPEREKIAGLVTTFDANIHSAPVHSQFVKSTLSHLKSEIERERTGALRGRVKPTDES